MHQSEVARIRERIEAEYQAGRQALTGLALGTARHEFINQRMERIGQSLQQLEELVGHEKASELIAETFKRLPDVNA